MDKRYSLLLVCTSISTAGISSPRFNGLAVAAGTAYVWQSSLAIIDLQTRRRDKNKYIAVQRHKHVSYVHQLHQAQRRTVS